MPSVCVCGDHFNVDHAMMCKRGGFVIQRHNELRDLEAEMLRMVCNGVETKPVLQDITGEELNRGASTAPDAWQGGSGRDRGRRFFDVRICHPNADSYRDMDLNQIYRQHETEKKRQYASRILEVEQATFTPLVFSTTGGMAVECKRYHSRRENMLRYLSTDIICSEKRTVFRERSSRKTVSFEEQIMSKDKYLSIFLKPNGGYGGYYPSNIFRNM